MDLYRFIVTNFRIRQTRALHEDTLHLSHTIYADGDLIASDLKSLGDFNNGDYDTQTLASPSPGLTDIVINDPRIKVAFVFQLINANNVSADALDGRITATSDQLAGIAAGLQGAAAVSLGSGAVPVALALEIFANLYTWLTVDCDGPVAADQISGPRYLIDAWADDNPTGTIATTRVYPGSDSSDGCGANSNYEVTWLVQHYRGWAAIADSTATQLESDTGLSAATHNGAAHVFGHMQGKGVTHARTFTGASWYVDTVKTLDLANLPVSAVNFNDRLYLFGVTTDGSIRPIGATADGGSWTTPSRNPAGLKTTEPFATAVFRNRLYVFARDSIGSALHYTSTADLLLWNPWLSLPAGGVSPSSPVAAAALGDKLFVFGIYLTGKPPETAVLVRNSTIDGSTWTGWEIVESGARPEGLPDSDEPLDVSATVFRDRIYVATRWESMIAAANRTYYIAVNFSSDGDNWSGWRLPESTVQYQPAATPGLTAVGNHLYIVAPQMDPAANRNTLISAH